MHECFFLTEGQRDILEKRLFLTKRSRGICVELEQCFFPVQKYIYKISKLSIVKALCTYERKLWWKMRYRIFTELAHWANSVSKSQFPTVCLSVPLCYAFFFLHLFTPIYKGQSPIDKLQKKSLGKS